MDFKMVVSSLVQGDIDVFKHFVVDLIEKFYKGYDPRVSIDQSKITELISRVHSEIDCIKYELMEDFK